MKRFIKVIVFCIGITQLIVLPVASQSRSLEWDKWIRIDSGSYCVIEIDISGLKDKFPCWSYRQEKSKYGGSQMTFQPSGGRSLGSLQSIVSVNFNYNYYGEGTREFSFITLKGTIEARKGTLNCEEIYKSGFGGTKCWANVILEDGRKAIVTAVFVKKL